MTYTINESIKCIVWDWNGTIYDDARICQDITNEQLKQLGLEPLAYETQEILFKHPVEKYYEDMGVNFKPGEFEKLSVEFHKIYGEKRRQGGVKPDALSLLRKIHDSLRTQVVLSAYKETDLQSLVEECELSDYFEAVLGLPDCHAVSKVSRGVDWLREHGLAPESVLIIGDTNHDFAVANELGAHCVLVPSGYQHKNLLLQTGAPVLSTLDEINLI